MADWYHWRYSSGCENNSRFRRALPDEYPSRYFWTNIHCRKVFCAVSTSCDIVTLQCKFLVVTPYDCLLWSPYVIEQTIIFSSCFFFLSFFFFFFFSSPNLSGRSILSINTSSFGPLTVRSVRDFGAPLQISTGFGSWQRYCTASSSGRQPNFAALNTAGRPSGWALDILVSSTFLSIFLSIFFIARLISVVADWMFTILWHMVWP